MMEKRPQVPGTSSGLRWSVPRRNLSHLIPAVSGAPSASWLFLLASAAASAALALCLWSRVHHVSCRMKTNPDLVWRDFIQQGCRERGKGCCSRRRVCCDAGDALTVRSTSILGFQQKELFFYREKPAGQRELGVGKWGDGAADQTPLHPEAGLSLRGVVPWLARAEGEPRFRDPEEGECPNSN